MTTRIVLLGRLRDGVDPAVYERWVIERDYPFSRGLASIANYEVSRVEGFLFDTEGKPKTKTDYVEIIDVPSLVEYQKGLGTEEIRRFLEEWSAYIEDFVALHGAIIE